MIKMKYFICIAIIYFSQTYADQSLQCGDWQVYKDEKCYKVFDTKELQSYDDAKNTCYQNEASSLVSIRSQEEQDFLFNLLHNIYKVVNDVWIGGHINANIFKWTDNTTVNYTNWANNYPINEIGYDCVKLAIVEPYKEKWLNEPCAQKNLVVCQKNQNWLFSYLQKTVMELRETVENITKKLEITELKLDKTEKELENTKITFQSELNSKTTQSSPPGTVAYFSHTTAPNGWLKANGQSVSRTAYANLFSAIGTRFGSGDGSTTFTLPDLRGEFIRGWSNDRDVDKDRTFGSFQWGSSIPFAGYIDNSSEMAGSAAYQNRYRIAGNTFDGGMDIDVPSGESRDGITFPIGNHFDNDISYIHTTNHGFVTKWNVLRGTRPRNLALLACIKF